MKYSINKKTSKSKKGFTLVELIVVLAIIGVLSAIATPTILSKVDEAKKQTDIANAASIAMAVKTEIAEGTITKDTSAATISTLIKDYFDNNTVPSSQTSEKEFEIKLTENAGILTGVKVLDEGVTIYPQPPKNN